MTYLSRGFSVHQERSPPPYAQEAGGYALRGSYCSHVHISALIVALGDH